MADPYGFAKSGAIDNDQESWMYINYVYDASGRRIEKQYDGRTVLKYIYDGDHCIAEYGAGNDLHRKYVYGPGVDQPICMIEATATYAGTYYYHFDGLGSVVALTNSSGNTVQVYDYSVYGQVGATDASHPNRLMFTAREFDKETGLYYYRARYYKPEIGRFLQVDPVGYGAGMNLYRYCRNNPLGLRDPFGLDPCDSGDCYDPCDPCDCYDPGPGDGNRPFDPDIDVVAYVADGKVTNILDEYNPAQQTGAALADSKNDLENARKREGESYENDKWLYSRKTCAGRSADSMNAAKHAAGEVIAGATVDAGNAAKGAAGGWIAKTLCKTAEVAYKVYDHATKWCNGLRKGSKANQGSNEQKK